MLIVAVEFIFHTCLCASIFSPTALHTLSVLFDDPLRTPHSSGHSHTIAPRAWQSIELVDERQLNFLQNIFSLAGKHLSRAREATDAAEDNSRVNHLEMRTRFLRNFGTLDPVAIDTVRRWLHFTLGFVNIMRVYGRDPSSGPRCGTPRNLFAYARGGIEQIDIVLV